MTKRKNIGYSLIELLLALGIILILSISAILIYNKISVSQKVKVLSDDMSYSLTEYKNALTTYPISSFPFNKPYTRYDMTPAIQSNFPLIDHYALMKIYRSNIGNKIEIFASQQHNDYTKPHTLGYSIKKHVDKEICIKLAMDNISKVDTIRISDAYYFYLNNKKNILTMGSPQKIATLKSISDACSDKKQDGMGFFYPAQ